MTRLDELRAEVDALIEAFVNAPNPPMMYHVAAEEEDEGGVPPSMQVGPVDVSWRATEEDIVAQRERVSAHAQGLHESFRSFLEDLFTPSAP